MLKKSKAKKKRGVHHDTRSSHLGLTLVDFKWVFPSQPSE